LSVPVPSADIWLAHPHKAHRGGVPLLCLPNAGGGASQFFAWARLLPPEVELCPIQLPGRENRLREAPLHQMDALLGQLADALAGYLNGPFAIFGHSLGGLIGFELARTLRRRYGLRPAHLFISSRRPPHLPPQFAPIHRLPDEMFLDELSRRYNGIPDLVRQDPEMLSLYLPILRADVTVLETHSWVAEQPLDCPISVFGGRDDTSVPVKDLAAWAVHSTKPVEPKLFPGGHFYHQTARQELLAEISSALATVV
jgi:medium-chain acyl-[acyl-carrier-protein] hydrolase